MERVNPSNLDCMFQSVMNIDKHVRYVYIIIYMNIDEHSTSVMFCIVRRSWQCSCTIVVIPIYYHLTLLEHIVFVYAS